MVTVVTVTTISAEAVHRVSLAGVKAKGKRGRTVTLLSFAYTQTIVRLYPNDRAPIPKRSCAYTQTIVRLYSNQNALQHKHSLFMSLYRCAPCLVASSAVWGFRRESTPAAVCGQNKESGRNSGQTYLR